MKNIDKNKNPNMETKGKKKGKFDGLGRVLIANNPNPKVQTIEEYMAQTFKKENGKQS